MVASACSVDIPGTFEAKGIKDAKSRLQFVAAEVREPFPKEVKAANPDTIMMKHFLSGFSDADAKIILKHISQIQESKAHILLLQTLVPEAMDKSHNVCKDGVAPGEFVFVFSIGVCISYRSVWFASWSFHSCTELR